METMGMSNGDWIRSMSDEEMADFLKDVAENFADNLFTCGDYQEKYGCMDCHKCYLEWVRQSKGET